ncbi:heat shock protein 70 A1-like [Adelges cooleyi]|uniref:heat shock protein 70 A1-like n=1 Tax=Adelges cooleyi TaxID=133065 RepID=UPI00217FAD14|nr:heat shock protein 70 A1-like [Adelges cooleyi]
MVGKTTIGIDLGTTFSCVGVWRNGKVEIIANEYGNRTTPSYVSFTDTERLVGEEAKNQAAINLKNTVFDAKRMIGRRFSDKKIQEDMKHWPFKVVDDCGNIKIQVEFMGEQKEFSPEEISSMILGKLKETAEIYLGEEVTDAVITVPAYFNDSQRQATIDAGTIAGLNVLKILVEPTAAALAYGMDNWLEDEQNILVFDLGGGTFDVSILQKEKNDVYRVKAIAGDTHLGGEDFDNRLVSYLASEFEQKYKKDIMDCPKALKRLRVVAERTKRSLSSQTRGFIHIDVLKGGIDYQTVITRDCFDKLCDDLFIQTINLVERALTDAKIKRTDIDHVVLVGGSTRITKIQTLLKTFFEGKNLTMSINPDEAVAYGATSQAVVLSEDLSYTINNPILIDVTPLSLGIEVGEADKMSIIIERNTPIPCTKMEKFTTLYDNQTIIPIRIFEGERMLTKDNNLLGSFDLDGIEPAPKRVPNIDVTLSINSNGILTVSATNKNNGFTKSIVIKNDKGRLSKQEIDRMISESECHKKIEDEKQKARITAANNAARNRLKNYMIVVQHTLNFLGNTQLTKREQKKGKQICDLTRKWLNAHQLAEKEEYEFMLNSLRSKCSIFIKKIDSM